MTMIFIFIFIFVPSKLYNVKIEDKSCEVLDGKG